MAAFSSAGLKRRCSLSEKRLIVILQKLNGGFSEKKSRKMQSVPNRISGRRFLKVLSPWLLAEMSSFLEGTAQVTDPRPGTTVERLPRQAPPGRSGVPTGQHDVTQSAGWWPLSVDGLSWFVLIFTS